jgi:hypothetical protein
MEISDEFSHRFKLLVVCGSSSFDRKNYYSLLYPSLYPDFYKKIEIHY